MRYAKIQLIPNAGNLVVAYLAASGVVSVDGPGVTQEDAVQLVGQLAMQRDAAQLATRDRMRVAVYDSSGRFLGISTTSASKPGMPADVRAGGATMLPLVGDAPLVGDPWARDLADAIDNVTRAIARAKTATKPPVGGAPIVPAGLPLAAAILVGGAAVAVIGSVAAWRYLDPELRRDTAAIGAAATAYTDRLRTAAQTGTMPGPSEIEKSVAERVRARASSERTTGLLVGGGIALGSAGLALGAAYLGARA